MTRPVCQSSRSARRPGLIPIAPLFLGLCAASAACGQDRLPTAPPGSPRAARPAPGANPGEIRTIGTPTPGARLTVSVPGAPDPSASYHWVQVDGPTVALGDATGPTIQFTVPEDARSLGFLVSIRDAGGQRTARLTIPVEGRSAATAARDQVMAPSSISAGATPALGVAPGTPVADAGDDQIGLVGRKITLNAGGSRPRGGLVYRWIALGGPRLEPPSQDGPYLAFTPTLPGTYRFGLIVAAARGDEASISELDEVVVAVGEIPSAVGLGGPAIPAAAIDQMLQGPGGPAARGTLEQAAGVFEAIAARASLYSSFGELSAELGRRLDGVVPADPGWRNYWAQAVFAPLTQGLTQEMLAAGLDLRSPAGQNLPLYPAHQERLQKLFASYAREFRSRAQPR